MEFALDDSQLELQQTVARFAERRFPLDGTVAREGAPVDRAAWADMAALGLFGLLLDEDDGGSGLGVVEAAIVFEQLGSYLVPGPLLWTVLAAGLVDGASVGARLAGGVDARSIVDCAALVEHAADLDVLLVVTDTGVVRHDLADLDPPEVLTPLDPLTPVARVGGLDRRGTVVGDARTAAALGRTGTVLSAAVLAGIAGRAVEVARTHALEREQFGVPIGSFQAVKHLLADMYVRASLAQSEVYAAAAVVDDPAGDDPARAAARAKLLAAEAAVANASTAVQVLGGMGFTWEMLPNHLLKRAWVLEHAFGAADEHAEALGASLVAGAR